MRLLLSIFSAILMVQSASAQSLWRNFFTTNQNPIVDVVAGSNATVQASTIGVNQRRFTVNSVPSGSGQTNWPLSSITNANYLTNWALLSTNTLNLPRTLGISVDGGGSAISSGTKGYISIPYSGTIVSCTLMASPTGSIEFNVWRTNSADASFPPTSVGAIGTNSLTSDRYNVDSTLTGWTTLLSSNDVIAFNISSNAATITNCTLQLKIQP